MLENDSLMLSRWAAMENAAKNLSTIPPTKLIIDQTEEGLATFLAALCRHRMDLMEDYSQYVVPLCPEGSDTYRAICLKYAFYTTWLIVNRLVSVYTQLLADGNAWQRPSNVNCAMATLNMPAQSMYHDAGTGVTVTADLIHRLYEHCANVHLQRICPYRKTAKIITGNPESSGGDNEIRIRMVWGSDVINDILMYGASLASYPVLPPNIKGRLTLVPKRIDLAHLSVLTTGIVSRCHVHQPTDERTCIACKIEALHLGLTDLTEQTDRLQCKCLFTSPVSEFQHIVSHYDLGYAARATIITRLLTLHGCPTGEHGCNCQLHRQLRDDDLHQLKYALDQVHI